jgi:hypothetical protein
VDTFVKIKGILKRPIYKVGPWYTLWHLTPAETYKSMSFSVEHDNDAQLFTVVDKVMTDVIRNQGITIVSDEGKVAKKADNLEFWPMDNFKCIQVETKLLSAPPAVGPAQ